MKALIVGAGYGSNLILTGSNNARIIYLIQEVQ